MNDDAVMSLAPQPVAWWERAAVRDVVWPIALLLLHAPLHALHTRPKRRQLVVLTA